MTSGSDALIRVADQPAADDQLAWGADHAERAMGHAELAMIDAGAGFDFQLVADTPQRWRRARAAILVPAA